MQYFHLMDARNVWASGSDVGGYNPYLDWNKNYEANALTDREVFRVFRDGAKSSNSYRVESVNWWLRSLDNDDFFYVYTDGVLAVFSPSYTKRVRPH